MLNGVATEYLEERGLDPEVCARYGLESRRPPGVSDGEWLAIPYVVKDREVNCKYRRIPNKAFAQTKGGKQCFWNEAVLDDPGLYDEPLIICEGELDALALLCVGFQRVVSVPGGAPNPDAQRINDAEEGARYRFIADAQQRLDRIRSVILACDADGPGYALMEDLATLLGPARCKFVPLPDHCKDANDVLIRFGAERLRECVVKARWVNVAGVRKFSDYPPGSDADPIIWRPDIHQSVDRRLGIMPGYTSIWTGIPGNGKSTLLNNVKWSLAEQYQIRSAMAMLEVMPNRDYKRIALQYRIGRPRDGGVGGHPWTQEEMDDAMAWLEEYVIPIDPNGYYSNGVDLEEVEPTLDWFLDAAQTAIVRHGVKFVALDPWGDITAIRDKGESEHEYIGRSLSRINRLARTLKAHIAIVAHPRKIEASTRGAMRPPGPYEIAGSSYFFNKTSLGVTVHRDPETDQEGEPIPGCTRTMVAVWKSKFHDVQGPPGKVYLRFNPNRQRFEGP